MNEREDFRLLLRVRICHIRLCNILMNWIFHRNSDTFKSALEQSHITLKNGGISVKVWNAKLPAQQIEVINMWIFKRMNIANEPFYIANINTFKCPSVHYTGFLVMMESCGFSHFHSLRNEMKLIKAAWSLYQATGQFITNIPRLHIPTGSNGSSCCKTAVSNEFSCVTWE